MKKRKERLKTNEQQLKWGRAPPHLKWPRVWTADEIKMKQSKTSGTHPEEALSAPWHLTQLTHVGRAPARSRQGKQSWKEGIPMQIASRCHLCRVVEQQMSCIAHPGKKRKCLNVKKGRKKRNVCLQMAAGFEQGRKCVKVWERSLAQEDGVWLAAFIQWFYL